MILLRCYSVFWLNDWVCVSGAESLTCPRRSHHPGTNWKMLPLEEVFSFALSYSSIVQQPWMAEGCISQGKSDENAMLSFVFQVYIYSLSPTTLLFPPPSAGLPSADPSELPQPGRTVRPEAAAAGGWARGGAARGPGGVSAGRGAEGRVRETEGGDETAAEQPEGEGQCWFVLGLCLGCHMGGVYCIRTILAMSRTKQEQLWGTNPSTFLWCIPWIILKWFVRCMKWSLQKPISKPTS